MSNTSDTKSPERPGPTAPIELPALLCCRCGAKVALCADFRCVSCCTWKHGPHPGAAEVATVKPPTPIPAVEVVGGGGPLTLTMTIEGREARIAAIGIVSAELVELVRLLETEPGKGFTIATGRALELVRGLIAEWRRA